MAQFLNYSVKIFILPLVLVFSACQKNNETDKSQKTQKTQDNPISIDTSPDTPIDLSKMSEPNRSKYECVQSLCGTEYPFKNKYETNPQEQVKNQAFVSEKLGKNIQLLMGRVIKIEFKLKEIIESFSKSKSDQIQFTDFQKGLLISMSYFTKFELYKALEVATDDKGNQSMKFNEDKLKKLNPKWTVSEIEVLKANANVYYKLISNPEPDYLTVKILLNYYKSVHTYNNGYANPSTGVKILSDEEALANAVISVQYQLKALENALVPELLNGYNKYILLKAVNKEIMSDSEKLDFFRSRATVQKYFDLYYSKETIAQFATLNFDFDSIIQSTMANYNKQLGQVIQNKKLLKGIFKNSEATCIQEFANSLTDTPTEAENKKALDTLALIQAEANTIIQKKSKVSIEPLNISFIVPKNQNESLEDWNTDLKATYEAMNETDVKVDAYSKDGFKLESNMFTTLVLRYFSQSEFFDSVVKTCKKSAPPFINDAAYPEMNTFIASWVTVKNLDQGIGIMAHEISHIISSKFNDLFKTEKSCLSSKQSTDQYQEEDFADFLSSKILVELKKNGQYTTSKNMSCGLGNINKTNPDEFSTITTNNIDRHSSQLYRILSVAAATGVQTSQCNQYLDKYEPIASIFKKYCELSE